MIRSGRSFAQRASPALASSAWPTTRYPDTESITCFNISMIATWSSMITIRRSFGRLGAAEITMAGVQGADVLMGPNSDNFYANINDMEKMRDSP